MADLNANEKDACGVGFIYFPERSHAVLQASLTALLRLEHRGACSADGVSGDGAGLLTSIPWEIFEDEGWNIAALRGAGKAVAVVVCFLPREAQPRCRAMVEAIFQEEQFEIVGWRQVPVNREALGPLAWQSCPQIEHLLVSISSQLGQREIDTKLTSARKRLIHQVWNEMEDDQFYISSSSTRTIVYKAMVQSGALANFYPDLNNKLFTSHWAVFHRRFSTNTVPKWRLAQPFRILGHNGEINTLQGNRNWLAARQRAGARQGADKGGKGRWTQLLAPPLVYDGSSDSANLDNVLESLIDSGATPEEGLMKLMPEATSPGSLSPQEAAIADFYEYSAAFQEPWDGPALIVYSDGRTIGSALDRNGLRPARYMRLANGSVILGSESGIYDAPKDQVVEMGRLGPGQMISIDLATGRFKRDREIKIEVSKRRPYAEILLGTRQVLEPCAFLEHALLSPGQRATQQIVAGYGAEDLTYVVDSMARSGNEPVFSMGDDTALACLSSQPRLLYDYFKQRFAQVTNPPIDYLRERLVMSLNVYLRSIDNRSMKLKSPFLSEPQLASLLAKAGSSFRTVRLSLTYKLAFRSLEEAIDALLSKAEKHIADGVNILVLSDVDRDASSVSIPPLLATGALHHRLIDLGLRTQCSIVVETAQCWSIHHFACLLSYGAQAVCPYLALETVRALADQAPPAESCSAQVLQANFQQAVENGLLKVISKMGISTLSSYIGAQIMECVGIGSSVVSRCFSGTPSPAGGISFADIERDMLRLHQAAYIGDNQGQPGDVSGGLKEPPNYGILKHRKDGEFHGNNPSLVEALHAALGFRKNMSGDARTKKQNFLTYSSLIRNRPPAAIRDLLTINSNKEPCTVDEVEAAEAIVKRFCSGGMSLGALSKEAHEVLAVAMNRLGGRSNSGEGGEDPKRYYPIADIGPDGTSPEFPGITGLTPGDRANSAIRQVASARFGVTAEYLVTAEQLEIKIAQGAKPGEGGQLPGGKVSQYIARLRRAKPGVTLISPPPHHDIYSIEDLAQLIFDLKEVNPHAKVSVKLVSSTGIGTIAVGVVKAGADIVQISGHDGGTGASPVSSIKHTGLPWEFGLREAARALMANGLRDRVQLRVDGGLRTGWDVVTAALLGADEFGFGSLALIAQGCIMARVCHTNNCPVGITSQKEALRQKFRGTPQQLVDFFLFVAEEVRQELANLGYRSLQEIIGRSNLLTQRRTSLPRYSPDLAGLLAPPPVGPSCSIQTYSYNTHVPPDTNELIVSAQLIAAVETHGQFEGVFPITNRDRAVGARVAGAIARRWGDYGFLGSVKLRFSGSAGQSFGAFSVKGMDLELIGDANDYVGKGMSGGQIVVKFPDGSPLLSSQNVLVGNTCLYGATGGALFVAGVAGERFAVRNCNAVAVVEGTGDHCCEYMTGGTVVVLGNVGRNFGAGMTGGVAYVFDEHDEFIHKFNADCDKTLRRLSDHHSRKLRLLLQAHQQLTGSVTAGHILNNWQNSSQYFWVVTLPEQEHTERTFKAVTAARWRMPGRGPRNYPRNFFRDRFTSKIKRVPG